MSDLKQQLIRLGEQEPELRNHLEPVIASFKKQANSGEHSRLFREVERAIDEAQKEAVDPMGSVTHFESDTLYPSTIEIMRDILDHARKGKWRKAYGLLWNLDAHAKSFLPVEFTELVEQKA